MDGIMVGVVIMILITPTMADRIITMVGMTGMIAIALYTLHREVQLLMDQTEAHRAERVIDPVMPVKTHDPGDQTLRFHHEAHALYPLVTKMKE